MAELTQNTASGDKTRKVRSRKGNSRVDLTAMVDLAFLLITFFMLTTSLSKPKAMDLVMPDGKGPEMPIDKGRSMTILIGADDKAKCYMGLPGENAPKEIKLGTTELRREITQCQKKAIAYTENPDKGLIVLIKPDKASNYGNLVDVLDEMAITGVGTYAITDIGQKEAALLK